MSEPLDTLVELRAELVEAELREVPERAEAIRRELAEVLDPELLGGLIAAARREQRACWTGPLRPPFPYYGGKFAIAEAIERAMGPIVNLVLPFGGSLGELLGRSRPATVETVNDADGLIINAWRALQHDPVTVAVLCDYPVHEPTLHAVHKRLVRRRERLAELLELDEYFYDAELAAWWIWGRSSWLGTGWCSVDKTASRKRPAIGGSGTVQVGKGIHASRPWAPWKGHPVLRGGGTGPGHGNGVNASTIRDQLVAYFRALSARLRRVRIVCGDWRRVLTPSVTTAHGVTGVVLDPPYALSTGRRPGIYGLDDPGLSDEAQAWALEHGDDSKLRIVVCGIVGEHAELEARGWSRVIWRGGKHPECLWLSPRCLPPAQLGLFREASEASPARSEEAV